MKCKMCAEEWGEIGAAAGNLNTKVNFEIYHKDKSWVWMTSRAGAECNSQTSGLDLGLDLVGLL